ncbi:MAG: SurA N-terminal domain-containing protein [Alphaproteobacteria bacterium]|nr:SurA N-terminal domain-containing protein [Alphaproteobacteria bacterium]
MLTSLRQGAASWLAKILFGLLILSFAVWGVGDYLSPDVDDAVAKVGESEIGAEEFRREYSRRFNEWRRRLGGNVTPELATQLGLPEEVLRAVIRRRLVEIEAARLGLEVGDGQVRRAIEADPNFGGRLGGFDRALFERVLLTNGLSEGEFVTMLRRDISRRQVDGLVARNVRASRSMAEAVHRYRMETRKAVLIRVPQDVALPEDPGEEELRAWHEANGTEFMAPAYRAVTAIVLDPDLWLDRVDADPALARDAYEARIEDFTVPATRRVQQVLFDDEAKAHELMLRLAAGAELEQAAGTVGAAVSDLGAVSRDQLPQSALAEAVFALNEEGVAGPVETPLGWHVLAVDQIAGEMVIPYEDVREGLEREAAREIAIERLADLANDLDDQLGGGATFEDAAGALDLPLLELEAVDESGRDRAGEQPEGLPAEPNFLRTVFSTPVGEDSLLGELGDGGYFVLRVESETPPAVRPFEEARPLVLSAWRNNRLNEAARARAEALAQQLREGRPLTSVADGLTVIETGPFSRMEAAPDSGRSREIVEAVFTAERGEVVVASAGSGYAIAIVEDIEPPPYSEEEIGTIREQLSAEMVEDVWRQFHAALEDRFGVMVNSDLLAQFN